MESLRISVNGRELYLFKAVDRGYFDYDKMNKALEYARAFLGEIRYANHHPHINYQVYVYEASEINAFTKKIAGQYVIAISLGCLGRLRQWFSLWLNNKKVCEQFGIADVNNYLQTLFEMAVGFLVTHEYYHVANGHCDLPKTEEHFWNESVSSVQDKNHALFLQCLEYDADCCATGATVGEMIKEALMHDNLERFLLQLGEPDYCARIEESGDRLELGKNAQVVLKERLKMLLFSIYSIYKIFNDVDQEDFDRFIVDDLYMHDHPYSGIRMTYVSMMVASKLCLAFEKELADRYIGDATQWVFWFEKEMLNATTKNNLFSVGFTEKGMKFIQELIHTWKYVRSNLEKYAYHALAPVEEFELPRYILNEEGLPIAKNAE